MLVRRSTNKPPSLRLTYINKLHQTQYTFYDCNVFLVLQC